MGLDGKGKQGTEGGVSGSARVEPEDELVEVGLQVLAPQPVVDASRPTLEVGVDLVDQGRMRWAGVSPTTWTSCWSEGTLA